MNAQGVKDERHLEELFQDSDYVAQEKLDGMRAIVHITQTGLRIFSRSAGVNDPSRPLENTSALPHLAALTFPSLAGTILDCEILLPGKDSAILAGSVHRKNGNAVNAQVKIFVFDILRHCSRDLLSLTFKERAYLLWTLESKLKSEHISFLPFVYTSLEKKALY